MAMLKFTSQTIKPFRFLTLWCFLMHTENLKKNNLIGFIDFNLYRKERVFLNTSKNKKSHIIVKMCLTCYYYYPNI